MAPEDFRLVPSDVSNKRGPKTSLYAQVVAQFVASPEPSVLVELPGKKTLTITRGLRRAIAASGSKVRVAQGDGKVYLYK